MIRRWYAALAQCGTALKWTAKTLRNDKEVVLAEVTQKMLQNDIKVVQAAFIQLLIQRYNFKTVIDSEVNLHVGLLICTLVSKQVLLSLDIIHVASACGSKWNRRMSNITDKPVQY